jgi:hypothetical protein
MAGLMGSFVTAEVALSAGVAKSVAKVVAPANHRLIIKSIALYFDGTSVSAEPALIEWGFLSTAGTFTSLTPAKMVSGDPETLQATGGHTATAEPTYSSVISRKECHTQAGHMEFFPAGQEPVLAGGASLGVRVTSPGAVNVAATIVYEE